MSEKVYVVCERTFAQPQLAKPESFEVLAAFETRAAAEGWAKKLLGRETPNSSEYPVFELTLNKQGARPAKAVFNATNWGAGSSEDVMKMHRWIGD